MMIVMIMIDDIGSYGDDRDDNSDNDGDDDIGDKDHDDDYIIIMKKMRMILMKKMISIKVSKIQAYIHPLIAFILMRMMVVRMVMMIKCQANAV